MSKLSELNEQLLPLTREARAWAESPTAQAAAKQAAQLVQPFLTGDADAQGQRFSKLSNAFATILQQHPAVERGDVWTPGGTVAYLDLFSKGKKDLRLQRETAAILTAGLVTLTLRERAPKGLVEGLLGVALGADDLSLTLRALLTKHLKDWPPVPPGVGPDTGFVIPVRPISCVAELRRTLGVNAQWLRQAGAWRIPPVDATGIRSVSPPSGTAFDDITIHGVFSPVWPAGARLGFTDDRGKTIVGTITSWDAAHVTAVAPHRVGDGPVALVLFDQPAPEGDSTAAFAFAETADGCLGPGGFPVIAAWLPVMAAGIQPALPSLPRLPGGENIFHGGPLLDRVLTPEVRLSDTVRVEGRNIEFGDQIEVADVLCPTQNVGATGLSATLAHASITGGVKDVRIVRRRGGSTRLSVRVLPTIARLVTSLAAPGDDFVIEGTALSSDLSATLNGEAAVVPEVRAGVMRVTAFRPRVQPPSRNPNGEAMELVIFDRGTEIARFPVTLGVYRIVALGDSIMWGQGLLESQKFSELAGGRISANGRTVYRVDRGANSGAAITNPAGSPADFACGAGPSAFDVAEASLPPNLVGEKNCGATSVAGQIAQWAAMPADVRSRVDLVLLNGGINDLGVMTMLDPLQSEAALDAVTRGFCDQMRTLLLAPPDTSQPDPSPATSALAVFPRATIIVTGYYPLVSEESDFTAVFAAAIALGVFNVPNGVVLGVGFQIFREKLIRLSNTFARAANNTLANAVNATGNARVKFVMPEWLPRNCTFAPDAFVFGIGFPVEPTDPVAAGRVPLCRTPCLNSGVGPTVETCDIASLGHPNAKGAIAYADAIMRVL